MGFRPAFQLFERNALLTMLFHSCQARKIPALINPPTHNLPTGKKILPKTMLL
jgi:hypothetical protein